MKKFIVFATVIALTGGLRASWYWPFGSERGERKVALRISELMEPATELIDEAADLAAEDKLSEAVEKYRAALGELDRIEGENPDRAQSAEFATLRNKRAYVNAAIDSLLLEQIRANAKAVATTDTTELEKKLAEERTKAKDSVASARSKTDSPSLREQAVKAIVAGRYAEAEKLIGKMLKEMPNGVAALNLKAVLLVRQEKYDEAAEVLDQAIKSHPKSHYAHYNMARLLVQRDSDDTAEAKRHYEMGRKLGGPVDEVLEALEQ